MFHNLERSIKPHWNSRPVYRAWSAEGNLWHIRWNGWIWRASENVYPFRYASFSTLKAISAHLEKLPHIKQSA